jgi:hypothetical protein
MWRLFRLRLLGIRGLQRGLGAMQSRRRARLAGLHAIRSNMLNRQGRALTRLANRANAVANGRQARANGHQRIGARHARLSQLRALFR